MTRTTTQNLRASDDEKTAWAQCAAEDGIVWNDNGTPRGNVSKWLRHLANREVARRRRRRK